MMVAHVVQTIAVRERIIEVHGTTAHQQKNMPNALLSNESDYEIG
jgi:hypothetical protein